MKNLIGAGAWCAKFQIEKHQCNARIFWHWEFLSAGCTLRNVQSISSYNKFYANGKNPRSGAFVTAKRGIYLSFIYSRDFSSLTGGHFFLKLVTRIFIAFFNSLLTFAIALCLFEMKLFINEIVHFARRICRPIAPRKLQSRTELQLYTFLLQSQTFCNKSKQSSKDDSTVKCVHNCNTGDA